MFNIFKSSGPKIIDKVWMSKQAKWKACLGLLEANPSCLFIAWFEDTFHELTHYLQLPEGQTHVLLTQHASVANTSGRMVIFVEHYPIYNVETALFTSLNLSEIPVLVSMDEALYKLFAGDSTVEVMKKLGIKEDEFMSHRMISRSLRRVQNKVAEITKTDYKAASQEKWLVANNVKK
jgi:hypothetical protein